MILAVGGGAAPSLSRECGPRASPLRSPEVPLLGPGREGKVLFALALAPATFLLLPSLQPRGGERCCRPNPLRTSEQRWLRNGGIGVGRPRTGRRHETGVSMPQRPYQKPPPSVTQPAQRTLLLLEDSDSDSAGTRLNATRFSLQKTPRDSFRICYPTAQCRRGTA